MGRNKNVVLLNDTENSVNKASKKKRNLKDSDNIKIDSTQNQEKASENPWAIIKKMGKSLGSDSLT